MGAHSKKLLAVTDEIAKVQERIMAKKRIGILTGGGDVPGLNSVIKTVTYRSSENDIEVVGFRRGWEGLTHLNLDDPASKRRYVMPLDRENTRTIDRRGGTVLHSSRTNPSKMQKLPDHLAGKDFPDYPGHQEQQRQDLGPLRAGTGESCRARHRAPDRHRR